MFSTVMTPGDIIRLNRLYKCPKKYIKVLKKLVSEVNKKQPIQNNQPRIDTQLTNSNKVDRLGDFIENLDDEDTKIDDMILNKKEIKFLYSKDATRRYGLTNEFFNHWPDAVVYYEFDESAPSELIRKVSNAMKYIEDVSCVHFKKKTENAEHSNYVLVENKAGCSSNVGMRNVGMQLLTLDVKRCAKGNIIHELLHTLGFLHMHTAEENKDFIKINWDNVRTTEKVNFEPIYAHVSMFNTTYEVGSIMHYPPHAFAINKTIPTIVSLDPLTSLNMGQRESK